MQESNQQTRTLIKVRRQALREASVELRNLGVTVLAYLEDQIDTMSSSRVNSSLDWAPVNSCQYQKCLIPSYDATWSSSTAWQNSDAYKLRCFAKRLQRDLTNPVVSVVEYLEPFMNLPLDRLLPEEQYLRRLVEGFTTERSGKQ